MNLLQLKQKLRSYILEQPIKPNVIFGSIYENLNTDERKYPMFNIDFESVNNNSNTYTYNIIVYFADRLTEDSSNMLEIQSDGVTSIHLFVQKLKYIDEITVTEPITINLFEQQFADNCAGAWARIMITVADNIDFCAVYNPDEPVKTLYITENGDYYASEPININVDVPKITLPEKELLMWYFNHGGQSLSDYKAQSEFDLDLSSFATNIEAIVANAHGSTYGDGIIIHGDLKMFNNYTFAVARRNVLAGCIIDGTLTIPAGSVIRQQAFYYSRIGKLVLRGCTCAYSTNTFQHSQIYELDMEDFETTETGAASSITFAHLTDVTKVDYVNANFAFATKDSEVPLWATTVTTVSTLIGEHEDEPYNENLAACLNWRANTSSLSQCPLLTYKSFMAFARGIANLNNYGVQRTIRLTNEQRAYLADTGYLSEFENIVISQKGWTIIYY
jgi:hypothetical protein